ncbi:hypothetical protein TNCV_211191 [Trichonephila clavipes]|uniref:Uncharacterized protein n=1 Tax=Trichonephila clavipes TaxID=2585209 RepID=A0A8X6T3D0_TRICX|nr:hypothetical protein TNCV_211191 [Trichonephila clavipes]
MFFTPYLGGKCMGLSFTENQLKLVLPLLMLYNYGYFLNWKKVNTVTSFGSKMVHCLTGVSQYAIEGWAKEKDHDMKIKQITKTPTKNGEGGRTPKHERSNEAERRRGEGKNAGRKTGRPKAVNQVGERSSQNPE